MLTGNQKRLCNEFVSKHFSGCTKHLPFVNYFARNISFTGQRLERLMFLLREHCQ